MNMQIQPKKSLGQHWLYDVASLRAVVDAAYIKPEDTVLEVGPGLGTLTSYLLKQAKQVITVELDHLLAKQLPSRFPEDLQQKLTVIEEDILKFNFGSLPKDYKLAANIPYYLTSHLLRVLSESPNPPSHAALLVQKEVAERMAAEPGQMSILAVSVQYYYQVELRQIVKAELFTPPPKVDSQIVSLIYHEQPLFSGVDTKQFFQIVKAGFSEKRKKLRSSLSGGLHIGKEQADELLKRANIDANLRAQNLSLEDWYILSKTWSL